MRDTGCDTWSRTSGGQRRQGGELRKEAARQGYAWRRQRAQQLCSLRAACFPLGGVVGGEALRLAPHGAGVLVETLRELATRGKRTSTSGTGSGEGAGARVAVRSVLED